MSACGGWSDGGGRRKLRREWVKEKRERKKTSVAEEGGFSLSLSVSFSHYDLIFGSITPTA